MNVIEATGLGKRYGSTQALHDCTLAIPAGHVTALVSPDRRRQEHGSEPGSRPFGAVRG